MLASDLKQLIIKQLSSGTEESIHIRGDDRGGLIRIRIPSGGSVVVKTWRARNFKEILKAIAGLSNARREWRMHRHLFRSGVDVPEPYSFHKIKLPKGEAYEILITEDVGESKRALFVLKDLIADGQDSIVEAFEDLLIQETRHIVRLRVLDIDHQLNNFILDNRDRLMRIDFECARRYPFGIMPRTHYAMMIARFITGHIHAVQPDVERSVRFVNRVYTSLEASPRTRARIRAIVNKNLSEQFLRNGVMTRIELPD